MIHSTNGGSSLDPAAAAPDAALSGMRVMPGKVARRKQGVALAAVGAVALGALGYYQVLATQGDLVAAAQRGDVAAVRSLLAEGGSVARRALDGKTPLEAAVGAGQGGVVRLLLSKKADPAEGMEAAARTGQYHLLRTLGDAGAKVKGDPRAGLWLCLAAQSGSKECVNLLLSRGADRAFVNQPDDGMTPLMYAARSGKAGVVKVLLDAKADVRAKTRTGRTALMLAAAWNEAAACKYLLEAGAELNARDPKGQTAVMSAAVVGNARTLSYLLSRGASTVGKDDAGKTVLDHARALGDPKILALIRHSAAHTAKPAARPAAPRVTVASRK